MGSNHSCKSVRAAAGATTANSQASMPSESGTLASVEARLNVGAHS